MFLKAVVSSVLESIIAKQGFICNNYLTGFLLQVSKIAVPLHPVISFSVINYVVSMRCPTRVAQLIFFIPTPQTGRTFLSEHSFLVFLIYPIGQIRIFLHGGHFPVGIFLMKC